MSVGGADIGCSTDEYKGGKCVVVPASIPCGCMVGNDVGGEPGGGDEYRGGKNVVIPASIPCGCVVRNDARGEP